MVKCFFQLVDHLRQILERFMSEKSPDLAPIEGLGE